MESDEDEEDEMGDADEGTTVNIPIAKFKSNNIKHKGTEVLDSESDDESNQISVK